MLQKGAWAPFLCSKVATRNPVALEPEVESQSAQGHNPVNPQDTVQIEFDLETQLPRSLPLLGIWLFWPTVVCR